VVRSDSDRVGIRLDGPPLERSRTDELPSEAVLPGAVQVPTDGRPIVFGPDAPVTGGYPVIAVLTDVDHAAQLRPGDVVRFSRRTGA
jgi:allophanate hydrolase subunit 2